MLWTQYLAVRGWDLTVFNTMKTPTRHQSPSLPPSLLWIIPISQSNLIFVQSELLSVLCMFCTANRFPSKVLLESSILTPWLISKHDPWRQNWKRFQERLRGEQLADAQTNSGSSSPPWVCLFWFCFAGVQGCAMNWAAANSHQFVRSSLTVIWEVWGGVEGGGGEVATDAIPPPAEWLLGTGPCSAGAAASKTRRRTSLDTRRIKIYAEPRRRFVKFEDIARLYSNME